MNRNTDGYEVFDSRTGEVVLRTRWSWVARAWAWLLKLDWDESPGLYLSGPAERVSPE